MTQPLASAVSYGTCWGTPNGQDLSSPSYMASGRQAVGEAIARRWSTTQGRLVTDPSYGHNLTDLVGADLSPSDTQKAQQQAAAQAEADPRVLACQVTLTLDVAGTLTATAVVTTADGPFTLVMSVGQVTPTTLSILTQ